MVKITDSELEIKLEGNDEKLVATPNALLAASRFKGGLGELIKGLQAQNVDCYLALLSIGLSHKKEKLSEKRLLEILYNSGGLNVLLVPLLEYVFMLQNGGKRYQEVAEEAEEGEEEAGKN